MNARQQLFLDEATAAHAARQFSLTIDKGTTPFQIEGHIHCGEGGETIAYYQDAKLVGLTSLIRDPFNRTILVCVDFTR